MKPIVVNACGRGWIAQVTRSVPALFVLLTVAACGEVATQPAAAAPPVTAPPVAAGPLKAEVLVLWSEILGAVAECDTRGQRADDVMAKYADSQATVYEAYDAATQAMRACTDASKAFNSVSPPTSSRGKNRDQFIGMLAVCKHGYGRKADVYTLSRKVLDGDTSPAAVQLVLDAQSSAEAGKLICVGDFAQAAEAAGISIDDLKTSG